MRFKIQLVIESDYKISTEDIIQLDKSCTQIGSIGLSLQESKSILKKLQEKMVLNQAEDYITLHKNCDICQKQRRIKRHRTIQFRTLFGIVSIPDVCLYTCNCTEATQQTFSLLKQLLPSHTSPELQYIETKWASLVSYGLTASLLKDVLPVSPTQNAATVRNHLHKTAHHQEIELADKPDSISGCPRDWGNLPKPNKPMIVGIDGGYVRNWHQKKTNFEVIAGKSFSKDKSYKRFGWVQKMDDNPRRRLMDALNDQGMQANQQIIFLSDGAENLKDLQYVMYPESEHILDWFHITMRLTVLDQFAAGLAHSDPKVGEQIQKNLARTKWFLWHGNVDNALEHLEDCCDDCMNDGLHYENREKMLKYLEEMNTYIRNNGHLIPNYGERYRYDETISTSFVESTINEVVAKRMVKKQQMQWTHEGAHYLLQTRTAVLNEDLQKHFERRYPGLKIGDRKAAYLPKAASF